MWTLKIRNIFSFKLNRETFRQRILMYVKPFTTATGHLKFHDNLELYVPWRALIQVEDV
jgi:hypothetical protein